jgi:hypothetical protein
MARLAVMAMNRDDRASAVDWASKALHAAPTNLTARIVLAASTDAPMDGITERLLREAVSGDGDSHEFMPACYAEVWWAKTWLDGTGRIGRPPSRER